MREFLIGKSHELCADIQSGNLRLVVTDNTTGRVLEAYAYDGSNAYSSESAKDGQQSDDPLTIYRSAQDQPGAISQKLSNGDKLDAKTLFNKMHSDPNVQSVEQETWEDGRPVYVLRSQQPIKLVVDEQAQTPMGLVALYFDTDTYELVGIRVSMERDNQEVLVFSSQIINFRSSPSFGSFDSTPRCNP